MLAETVFFRVLRQIIHKVQINDILPQITAVGQIQNICIVFSVSSCICFGKLAFPDTGNPLQKNDPLF